MLAVLARLGQVVPLVLAHVLQVALQVDEVLAADAGAADVEAAFGQLVLEEPLRARTADAVGRAPAGARAGARSAQRAGGTSARRVRPWRGATAVVPH